MEIITLTIGIVIGLIVTSICYEIHKYCKRK